MFKIIISTLILLAFQSSLHAGTIPTLGNTTKLYIATFNRAPDSAGLDYWVNTAKLDLESIAQSFFDQPETKKAYPADSTNTDFVKSVYQNLFNRVSEAAGLKYWVEELDSGHIVKSTFILAVINGAQDTEEFGNDASTLKNKTTVGLAFSDADLNNVEDARMVIANVTDKLETVVNALEMIIYLTSTVTTKIFNQENKTVLHNLFLSEYLWYDQVASNVDYTLYSTPQEMIDGLKLNPPDQWSFTITEQEYKDFANQETSGFGFGYTADFILYSVRINAPAYGNLLRGDRILEVNGQPVTQDNLTVASNNLNVVTTFTVLRSNTQLAINVTPRRYSFNVSLGKVINQNGTNIGYLRYDAFTESSVAEFETIFSTFKAENISELVIDLRYNGGGSIITASILLDNISNAYPGERQVYLDWNANYQHKNSTYTFESIDLRDGNELNMKRVIFLVTYNSASASELVISALKPYLGDTNVVTIGTATHGKPVGMSGRTDGSFYYFLINFYIRNNADETTSFYGIPATCNAEDDFTHLMGDINEAMLSTALYYISYDACP